MFEPVDTPRVFGLSPGVDFPRALVSGLLARHAKLPPEALARTHVIVNTARMKRRVLNLLRQGPARLLPKVHLLTQLDLVDPAVVVPPPIPPLRRRLELISLVSSLLERQRDLAPRSSLYDLTDSLAALIDEMQGEGVSPETIRALDVSDQSGHWERAQAFINIAQEYLRHTSTRPDAEAHQRQLVASLAKRWCENPVTDPVILAGSSGSRGTTQMLMQAVAKLPQGALVLPGFDNDMAASHWATLNDPMLSEDHPQYRFHKLLKNLGLETSQVMAWDNTPAPCPPRNALVSLSLRPAPFTDAWLSEGPKLKHLDQATANITMLEAPEPRSEALAIALRLRAAVETGQKAAVITPDRTLTRQITATLDQWDLLPDDSAGSPLHLSPPGRFLRHVAALLHRKLDAEGLLTLLKHPLTHSGAERGSHVLNTQRLELYVRDKGMPYPDAHGIRAAMQGYPTAADWVLWLTEAFTGNFTTGTKPLGDWVDLHLRTAELIATGPAAETVSELWRKKAGEEAYKTMVDLQKQARFGGEMTAADYADLVGALLANGEVRDRDAPHPGIMIWGTLEARVQGADLVILASLNDGTWPEAPAPDPWLNRALRHDAGLLLPDRRIGLSAHDYQQAIAAPEVWITRAIRSDDAETVASRWVNRLRNLLEGLPAQSGPALVKDMIVRGDDWLGKAAAFEAVKKAEPAKRPSPCPPVAARPRRLAVTDIKHLIRDPYAIYGKHILRLRPIGPLVQTPDALLRGTVSHDVMEAFIAATQEQPAKLTSDALMEVADKVLDEKVPWPAARHLWKARLERISEWFIHAESLRREQAAPALLEAKGTLEWSDLGFTLTARADRIDIAESGSAFVYDYKTGRPPTKKQQKYFDKQLLIEAGMIEQGVFADIGARPVSDAVFIGLGASRTEEPAPLADEPPAETLAKLKALVTSFSQLDLGYTSRKAVKRDDYGGDYDGLARFGEWDGTDDACPEDLT